MTVQSMFVLFLLFVTLLGFYLECKCGREGRSRHKDNHEMRSYRKGLKSKKGLERMAG
ncbi:MAG: hypothetical protein ACYSR0_12490 [Planctomycetota bacterium]